MENIEKMHYFQNTQEKPKPLMREISPASPFPVDSLGNTLSTATKAIEDKTQAPIAICGQSVLACATLTVQSMCDIELPTGQIKPVSNNYMSIAASGERKSACDNFAIKPIREFENELRETHRKEAFEYETALKVWIAEHKKIEKVCKKKTEQEFKARLEKHGQAPIPPTKPIIICTEPTFEGLCRLYKEGRPSIGIFSAEGGQFIGGHGMNEENKLRTITGLSSLWDGDPIRRVRAVDGTSFYNGKRCSAHLMVQPEVSAIMLGDNLLSDQGMLSRMLVTFPESNAGKRFWKEPDPRSDTDLRAYNACILDILRRPLPTAQNSDNELKPRPLPLSTSARDIWVSYMNTIESKIGAGKEYEPIRGLANKLPEHAMRMAAVLNYVDNHFIGEIEDDFMHSGIELAEHYAKEALRLYGASRVNPDIRLAEKLLTWLNISWTEPIISLPDIYQRSINPIRDKATALKIVKILEDHHWITKTNGMMVVKGEKRKDVWQINKLE
jgi:hypothetical protein